MIETLHHLVQNYGLYAVLLGSLAEGESAAILGGFFSHQGMFHPYQAFGAALLGAFLGDTAFFFAGRELADKPFIVRIRQRPGFSHALAMVQKHPNIFVLSNRFIYGLRLVGGVASGMAHIPVSRFVVLNFISSVAWAAIFTGLGYVFGLSAEKILGDAVHHHHRVVVGLGLGVIIALAAWAYARHRRQNLQPDSV